VKTGTIKRRMDMVKQHGQYTENGWRYKKDGTKYYAEIALFGLYNEQGELIGMTNVSKDITKLKIAENEIWFQKEFAGKLIEGSERALVVTNAAGMIHYSNQRAVDLLKMESPVGQKIWNYIDTATDGLPENKMPETHSHLTVKIKATGTMIDTSVKAAKDELSLIETYVFFFYTEEAAEDRHK
jgi:PAS domain-containing protein